METLPGLLQSWDVQGAFPGSLPWHQTHPDPPPSWDSLSWDPQGDRVVASGRWQWLLPCTAGSILLHSLSTVLWAGGEGCEPRAGMEMGCPAPSGRVCLSVCLSVCLCVPCLSSVPAGAPQAAVTGGGSGCPWPMPPPACWLLPGISPKWVTWPQGQIGPRPRDWRAPPCPSWTVKSWIRALLLPAQAHRALVGSPHESLGASAGAAKAEFPLCQQKLSFDPPGSSA